LLVQCAVKHTGVCHGTHTYMYVHKHIAYTQLIIFTFVIQNLINTEHT